MAVWSVLNACNQYFTGHGRYYLFKEKRLYLRGINMYIQLTNVSKKIKSNDILKDINLRMESGKIYGFK